MVVELKAGVEDDGRAKRGLDLDPSSSDGKSTRAEKSLSLSARGSILSVPLANHPMDLHHSRLHSHRLHALHQGDIQEELKAGRENQ